MTQQSFGPYPAEVLSVHDGDTITVRVDLGFDTFTVHPCRVFGINAPELSTAAGKAALQFALTLVKPGDKVTTVSHDWDKYGDRYDGDIILPDGRDFATLMVAAGQAVKKDYK
jgi:endonuclease YncB( thermonuclease family)